MITLTPTAVGKVKEILDSQEPKPSGLRIAVVGNEKLCKITEQASAKLNSLLTRQGRPHGALRIAVVGGGCSGFSYSMAFENTPGLLDKAYEFDGLKVFIDQASLLYLDGAEVDFVETLEGSGFKFNNPQVKSTCGCGSSFSA